MTEEEIEKQLDKLIEEKEIKDQVIFKGRISDREELARETNETDVFLFPSHNKGLPNAVIEAVACEGAVICTEVGGVKEITNQNIAFQIILPININAITGAVQELKRTDIEILRNYAKKNRQKLVEKFSPDAELKSFHKIIEKTNLK